MVRRSVLAMFAVMAIVLGGVVVVSTPAGAVVDDAVVVPSPNAGTSTNQLFSVSCVSVSSCVAVGFTVTGSTHVTLVMVWDGSVWSIVSSPNVGTIFDVLNSVSCVSASSCVAVGHTDTGSVTETLVLSLTGPVPPSTTTTTVPPSTTTVASDQVVPAFTG